MTTVVATIPRGVKSFRLARPVAAGLTACTLLSLAALGVWLFVLPFELLRLVST